ncbi:hypothetical protein BJX76DRAFT_355060 [Aspergillus varians]
MDWSLFFQDATMVSIQAQSALAIPKPPPVLAVYVLSQRFACYRDTSFGQSDPAAYDLVPSTETLLALSLTSREFHGAFQPLLYQTIRLSHSDQLRVLLQVITTKPELAGHVQSVTFFEQLFYHPLDTFSGIQGGSIFAEQREGKAGRTRHLWDTVQQFAEGTLGYDIASWYDCSAPEARDAVLDLIALLLHLPNLKRFRHFGLPTQTTFQRILLVVLLTLERSALFDIDNCLFPKIEEVHLSGLSCDAWLSIFFNVLSLPSLRTLWFSYPFALKASGVHVNSASFALSTVRDLRLSGPIISPKDLCLAMSRMERVEVFRYEWFPSASIQHNDDNPFIYLMTAVESQKRNLTDLRLTINRQAFQHSGISATNILPWTFESYPRLTVLSVPDMVFFDIDVILYPRLSPSLQHLMITAWHIKDSLPEMLRRLALDSLQTLNLKTVRLRELCNVEPYIGARLGRATEAFSESGIVFVHELV